MTKEIKNRAKELFANIDAKELFVNEKGEFFTRRDYAENSSTDKSKITVINRNDVSEVETPNAPQKSNSLVDLTKAELVELAKSKGLELDVKKTKVELISAIESFKSADDSEVTEGAVLDEDLGVSEE